jgi:hypothetical protein
MSRFVFGFGTIHSTWFSVTDPKTQSTFYCNAATGECQWNIDDKQLYVSRLACHALTIYSVADFASTAAVAAVHGRATQSAEKTRWWEILDPACSEYYYYDTHTSQTSWFKPAEISFFVRIHPSFADEADSESDSDEGEDEELA